MSHYRISVLTNSEIVDVFVRTEDIHDAEQIALYISNDDNATVWQSFPIEGDDGGWVDKNTPRL